MESMGFSDNIIPTIFILGLIQGVIFGPLLIYLNQKRDRSTLFLGLFILAYSINYIKPISKYLNLTDDYSIINSLPFDFRWLLFPLFYVYIKNVSILPKSKKVHLYLIPGILMFAIDSLIFFKASTNLETLRNSNVFEFIHHYGAHAYSIFIFYKTYQFINRHVNETNNQYASTSDKELKWAKAFMLIGVVFTLVIHFRSKVDNFYIDLLISMINVGLLYWICIYGLRQHTINNLIQQKPPKIKKVGNKLKNKITEIDKNLFEEIEQLIRSKETYRNPDLNIIDIANLTNEHPKKISIVINTISNKNFKSYINGFRIEKAKKLLKSNSSDNFSIEGISIDVGFKSKSTFYEAFKKETGTTPLKYKDL